MWEKELCSKCGRCTEIKTLVQTPLTRACSDPQGECHQGIIAGVNVLANVSFLNPTLYTPPCYTFIKIRAFPEGTALPTHMSLFLREKFSNAEICMREREGGGARRED